MRKAIVIALTAFVYTSQVYADNGDFCIYFYKQPYHEEEVESFCGSLGESGVAGRTNINMPVIGSLTAPDWVKVELFDKPFYQGQSQNYQGNQDEIAPTLNVQSVKVYRV
ncbi:MAG: hypothetical protein J3R72DRAFT_460573 [Linnemannia gamsii]|nr:MAG: hypothetical protein J3R72DRAFT_460573 [Linnemannia gamsii]